MTHTIKTDWVEGLHFTSNLDEQKVGFDATAFAGEAAYVAQLEKEVKQLREKLT